VKTPSKGLSIGEMTCSGFFATINIKPDQRDTFLATIRETAQRSVNEEPGGETTAQGNIAQELLAV
jgi:hypothetical protein